MAEYAWAILAGRPHFHISLIVDVSPYCDCHAENDAPVQNSILAEHIAADPEEAAKHDHFHNITPESEWKVCLEHAEKIGMGTRSYELITVK